VIVHNQLSNLQTFRTIQFLKNILINTFSFSFKLHWRYLYYQNTRSSREKRLRARIRLLSSFLVYKIKVFNSSTAWAIYRRYSAFQDLRSSLLHKLNFLMTTSLPTIYSTKRLSRLCRELNIYTVTSRREALLYLRNLFSYLEYSPQSTLI
jgi:hypothetical protein